MSSPASPSAITTVPGLSGSSGETAQEIRTSECKDELKTISAKSNNQQSASEGDIKGSKGKVRVRKTGLPNYYDWSRQVGKQNVSDHYDVSCATRKKTKVNGEK